MRPVPSLFKAGVRRLDPGTSPAIFQPNAFPGRKPGMPTVSVTRRVHFNAAHRLHNPAYPEDWNARVYGVCANPNYHGHNYELDLRGLSGDEAEHAVVAAIDAAVLAEQPYLRVIHGKGTGAVRERVQRVAKGDRRVQAHAFAPANQGGTGVTILEFGN